MKYLGISTPPNDWAARTSGAARYTADLRLDGLLVARVLRSPHPHARIIRLDTSRAERMPGVHAIVTMADFPAGVRYMHEGGNDRPPLADGIVRYVGQEIAAVAAENPAQAQAALDAIRISYRKLSAPFSIAAAQRPGARQLHERPAGGRNVSKVLKRRWGDPEGARTASEAHVSGHFVFGRQTHASMEPNSVLAMWDGDRLHLWNSSQSPLYVRDEVAHVMGLAEDQVICHEVCVGGGFGSKSRISEHEAIAGALARKAGRPVRLALDRSEEFETTKSRHPFHVSMSLHGDLKGHLNGIAATIKVENGAYDHSGFSVTSAGMKGAGIIYRPQGIAMEAELVDTALLPGGQFRGYGTTQVTFAIECLIDEMARRIGWDPIDYRIFNANLPGETTLIGAVPQSTGLVDCLLKVRSEIGWDDKRGQLPKGQGLGVSAGAHLSGSFADRGDPNRSDAAIDLYADGRIRVRHGTADAGTGQRTLFAMIAAEVFDVPVTAIEVFTMDTAETTYDVGAWSSRGTHYSAHAVRMAAEAAAAKLRSIAAGRTLSVGECVAMSNEAVDGCLTVHVSYVEPTVSRPDPKTQLANVSPSYNYAAHAVHVAVDRRTGEVRILDYVAVHDVGTPLNPVAVKGQIVGATAMGIGAALREEMIFEQGKLANTGYLHYALPRAADVPPIRAFTAGGPDPVGPFGAKAVGELGINPPPSAIANAINDAIGIRFTELPITPDKILNALAERDGRRRDFGLWRRPGRWWIALVRWAYPRGLFRVLHAFRSFRPSRRIPDALERLDLPETLDGALALLGPESAPLGGGTDLMPRRSQGLAPDRLVSVTDIAELTRIEQSPDGFVILGGAVTLAALEGAGIPLLAEAASTIASPQVRNMAMIAGNLAQEKRCWFFRNGFECYKRVGPTAPCYAINGDHRFYHAAIDGHRCQAVTPSDLATALTALEAGIDVAGPSGRRLVPIEQFYTGPGETILRPDELIVSVEARQRGRGAFEKLKLWEGDFAVVSVALLADIDPIGNWRDLRIVCGGIAPVPWRARRTEEALAGTKVTPESFRAAFDRELNARAHPLARNGWKLDALAGLGERAVERLLA